MKVKNRILAAAMTCVMILSLCVFPAFAEEAACAHANRTEKEIKAATCTVNGISKKTCGDCGDVEYFVVPAHHTVPAEGAAYVDATCAEAGSVSYVCANCGEEAVDEIPATGDHTYGYDVKDATCTENAKVGHICSVCKAEDPENSAEEVPDSVLGHEYESAVTTEASCTENGVITYSCVRCDDSYTEEIDALGHKMGESAVLPADCENNEREVVYCSVCEEIMDTNDLYLEGVGAPATGHTWGDFAENGDGTHSRVCATCGGADGHDCEYEEVVTPATCSTYETTTYTCTVCGYEFTETTGEEYDADVHVYGEAIVKAETCTVNGIGKKVCVCGATDGYYVIKAAHVWNDVAVITAADCTNAGAGTKTCSVCSVVEEVIIDALGHDAEWVTLEAETCGTAGSEIQMCTRCLIEIGEAQEIPATGEHNYAELVIDADCLNPAKVGMICTVCAAEKEGAVEFVGEALGHDYVSAVTTEATCIEAGEMTYTCSRCEESYTEEIPSLGHKTGEGAVLPADCENNEREVIYCATCDEIIVTTDLYLEGVGAEAYGHTWGDYASDGEGKHVRACSVCDKVEEGECEYGETVTPANCSNYETTTYTCAVCEDSYTEVTGEEYDADVHVYNDAVVKAATCTVNGIGKKACECGATNGYYVIKADHTWNEVEATTAATCTEAGAGTKTCAICSAVEEVVIDALGHDAEWVTVEEANCGTAGSEIQMCITCLAEIGEAREIPASGEHDYAELVIDADCLNPAKVGMICNVCGDEQEGAVESVGDALGHDYVSTVTKETTCVEAGENTFTCSRCEDSYTEEIAALGHKNGESAVLPADCENNEREVIYCATCDEIIATTDLYEAGVGEMAYGHDYSDYVSDGEGKHVRACATCEKVDAVDCAYTETVVPATCNSYEAVTYTCDVCGYSYTEIVGEEYDPNVHNYADAVVKAATCTANGIGKKACTCGATNGYFVIKAGEHQWNDVVVSSEATCTAEGAGTRTCTLCGETEDVVIDMLPHAFGEEYANDASTAVLQKCADCGYIEVITTFEGFEECGEGHTPVVDAAVAATCAEDGLTEGSHCASCGTVIVAQEAIDATGHAYEESFSYDDNGGAIVTYTCTACGDSYTESSEN